MTFLKNLFGGNKRKLESNKPNLDQLLSSKNVNNSVIELDNYIGGLCSYGDTLEKLTAPQQNFYFNQNIEREINNGGVNQFFKNSSGEFAHETVISLGLVGANKTAEILQQAIDQFPDSYVPKDRNEREKIVTQIEEHANEVWNQLDQKFFAYEDNLNELNIEYVKQNREAF